MDAVDIAVRLSITLSWLLRCAGHELWPGFSPRTADLVVLLEVPWHLHAYQTLRVSGFGFRVSGGGWGGLITFSYVCNEHWFYAAWLLLALARMSDATLRDFSWHLHAGQTLRVSGFGFRVGAGGGANIITFSYERNEHWCYAAWLLLALARISDASGFGFRVSGGGWGGLITFRYERNEHWCYAAWLLLALACMSEATLHDFSWHLHACQTLRCMTSHLHAYQTLRVSGFGRGAGGANNVQSRMQLTLTLRCMTSLGTCMHVRCYAAWLLLALACMSDATLHDFSWHLHACQMLRCMTSLGTCTHIRRFGFRVSGGGWGGPNNVQLRMQRTLMLRCVTSLGTCTHVRCYAAWLLLALACISDASLHDFSCTCVFTFLDTLIQLGCFFHAIPVLVAWYMISWQMDRSI